MNTDMKEYQYPEDVEKVIQEIELIKAFRLRKTYRGIEITLSTNLFGTGFGMVIFFCIFFPIYFYYKSDFDMMGLIISPVVLFLYVLLRLLFYFTVQKKIIISDDLLEYSKNVFFSDTYRSIRREDIQGVKVYRINPNIKAYTVGLRSEGPLTEIKVKNGESLFFGVGLSVNDHLLLAELISRYYQLDPGKP